MLYAGLDLSRRRLDVHVLDEDGRTIEVTAVRPDTDALRTLAAHVLRHGQEVSAAIESMTGARFVHDTLEIAGWDVAIADAAKVKGIAPLAAKTDKIDARVLAELARRDLVPEIWLPTPDVRAERERARFRLHLVHHRTALKNRIHATLMTFGHPVSVADLFGVAGRERLAGFALPEPWTETLRTSLRMVDQLGAEIDACEEDLRRLGADHPSIPLLLTVPQDRSSPRLHDRLGDRRHPPVLEPEEVGRIHRAVPAGSTVGQPRCPWATGEERAEVPPLGADRSGHPRGPRRPLSRTIRADEGTPRPAARREGRPDRPRPQARRSDLAHPHQE